MDRYEEIKADVRACMKRGDLLGLTQRISRLQTILDDRNEEYRAMRDERDLLRKALGLACQSKQDCPNHYNVESRMNGVDPQDEREWEKCRASAGVKKCPKWDELNENGVGCWIAYFIAKASEQETPCETK